MFLKIFLVGIERVGKTQLLNQFCAGKPFDGSYVASTGPDFSGTKIKLQDGQSAILQIWDFPGGKRHAGKRKMYYADTHCFVLVCDMLRMSSLEALEDMQQEILEACEGTQDSISFVLLVNKAEVGNKNKQQVFWDDVAEWCDQHNISDFYETSAALDTNIVASLLQIAKVASQMFLKRRGIRVKPKTPTPASLRHLEKYHAEKKLKEDEEEDPIEDDESPRTSIAQSKTTSPAASPAAPQEETTQEEPEEEEEEEDELAKQCEAALKIKEMALLRKLDAEWMAVDGGAQYEADAAAAIGAAAGAVAVAAAHAPEAAVPASAKQVLEQRIIGLSELVRFSLEDCKHLRKFFLYSKELDKSEFVLAIKEFRQAHWTALAGRMFSAFDRGRKGCVDYEDFVLGLDAFINGTRRQRAEVTFNMFVAGGHADGGEADFEERFITREQIAEVVREITESAPGVQMLLELGQDHKQIRMNLDHSTNVAVSSYFAALDLEGSPTLSEEQYVRGIITKPHLLQIFDFHKASSAAENTSNSAATLKHGQSRSNLRTPRTMSGLH